MWERGPMTGTYLTFAQIKPCAVNGPVDLRATQSNMDQDRVLNVALMEALHGHFGYTNERHGGASYYVSCSAFAKMWAPKTTQNS